MSGQRSYSGTRHRPTLRWARPLLERLECRTLLATSSLSFTAAGTSHQSGFLADPSAVDFYRFHLDAGDRVLAAVTAQTSASGLQGRLGVLNAAGSLLALDDQEGGDPHLNFQAAAAGDYIVDVSADGRTTGLYTLDLRRE
jgi:hypothetical protein